MDRLKRLREPAVAVALTGLVLNVPAFVLYTTTRTSELGVIAPGVAYSLADPALLLLLTALVFACWLGQPTTHARGLTLLSLILTALLVAAAVGLNIAGLVWARSSGDPLDAFTWTLPPLTVGVIAVGAQAALLRRSVPVAAGRAVELDPVEPEAIPADPQLEPGWAPGTAVGTVWRRAGDAGSEGPATSWDAPGQAHPWWGPAPNPELPAAVPRPTEE